MPFRLLAAILCATAILLNAYVDAYADGRRRALVIGNSAYPSAPLRNPKQDSSDISDMLKQLGFEVALVQDVNKRHLEKALETFARNAEDQDILLVYYAGHALQFQGTNYLMPVDAELEDKFSIPYQMVNVDAVKQALDSCQTCLKLLILDACRNNPLANRLFASSRGLGEGSRGLARWEDRSNGFIIAYATQPGKTAADGDGRNSPFAAALLKELKEPQVPVVDVFIRVQSDVMTATNNQQSPELSISGLSPGDHLYFLNNNESDSTAFMQLDIDNLDQLQQFVTRFPQSAKRPWVEKRIGLLSQIRSEQLAQKAAEAETARKAEADRLAAEAKARDEKLAQQKAVADEATRKAEADRQAAAWGEWIAQQKTAEAEAKEKAEAARLAEAKARDEKLAQQKAAEAEAARKAEADRLAAAAWGEWIAQQKTAEAEAKKAEADRLAEAKARDEKLAQKAVADEAARKFEADRQAAAWDEWIAQQKTAEAAAKEKVEADRLAEAARKAEADRLAAEVKARDEKLAHQKDVADAAAWQEWIAQQKVADVEAARKAEAARLAADAKARDERMAAQKAAADEAARQGQANRAPTKPGDLQTKSATAQTATGKKTRAAKTASGQSGKESAPPPRQRRFFADKTPGVPRRNPMSPPRYNIAPPAPNSPAPAPVIDARGSF